MNQKEYDGSERASWGFIGSCGDSTLLEKHGAHTYINDIKQYVIWMKIGVAFLQHTIGEAPIGCSLGILWANSPHGPGKFPIIALGSDNWNEEAKEYFDRTAEVLIAFDKAVDWSQLPRALAE